MNNQRYVELESNEEATLTPEEMAQGWHWCDDWDYMLIGPGMSEFEIKSGRCYACGIKLKLREQI